MSKLHDSKYRYRCLRIVYTSSDWRMKAWQMNWKLQNHQSYNNRRSYSTSKPFILVRDINNNNQLILLLPLSNIKDKRLSIWDFPHLSLYWLISLCKAALAAMLSGALIRPYSWDNADTRELYLLGEYWIERYDTHCVSYMHIWNY